MTVSFDGIGQLQKGDHVRIKGVPVGKISSIDISDDFSAVDVVLAMEKAALSLQRL